jgi:hypothetical protein
MATRLVGLRDVPEDELEGIESVLTDAGIEHYQSPPGLFGLSPAALWLKHEVDLERARALVASYQAERARLAREAWQRAQAAGEVPGLWQALRQRPWHALGLLVLVLGVLFALSLPWLGLGR